MTTNDPTPTPPTSSLPPVAGPGARLLRPRTLATQLFADALADDHDATDRLRWLALADDPTAAAAFTAIIEADLERNPPPERATHRLDQLLAAVHEATAARPTTPPTTGDRRAPRR